MIESSQFNQATGFTQETLRPHKHLCSLGRAWQALIFANALLFCLVFFAATGWSAIGAIWLERAIYLQPSVLFGLFLMCILARQGARKPYTYCVAAGLVAGLCFTLISYFGQEPHPLIQNIFLIQTLFYPTTQAALFGAILGWCLWFFWIRPESTTEQPSVNLLAEANIRSLGAAIRPHFFFNALNAVMGLIRTQPKLAESVLLDTAELFRDVMHQDHHRLITVSEELAITQRYSRIEQARLAERLALSFQVDAAIHGALLPPFCLQVLVENAIRHGVEPSIQGEKVSVSIWQSDGKLCLKVSNSTQAKISENAERLGLKPGNGIALANLQTRLKLMYAQSAQFWVLTNDANYAVYIEIPLEFA